MNRETVPELMVDVDETVPVLTERESGIVSELTERFPQASAAIQRPRRIWASSERADCLAMLACLHDELGFGQLCTVTGLDTGSEFQLIYHIATPDGIVLSLRQSAPHDDAVFDTVTDIYKGGTLYEVEACNILGITINGIPADIRYPLPDDWPEGQYPLRKDWQPEVEAEAEEAEAEGADAESDAASETDAATDEEAT
ncbi:MAG: NADH-quinone oxidoreductase subunit C [Coriobacteriia bacterium]|nr:NADH-quinone oxidoreductase subunit C [Coriobacteriia bacterium]